MAVIEKSQPGFQFTADLTFKTYQKKSCKADGKTKTVKKFSQCLADKYICEYLYIWIFG